MAKEKDDEVLLKKYRFYLIPCGLVFCIFSIIPSGVRRELRNKTFCKKQAREHEVFENHTIFLKTL